MIQPYKDKNHCCGCTACLNVCHFQAITMEEDSEGFLYPVIQKDTCVDCGNCAGHCAFNKTIHISEDKKFQQRIYAAYLTDKAQRMKSQSGGAFWALALQTMQKGGAVYGAAVEGYEVRHIRVVNTEELERLRGSKYIQSIISVKLFEEIKRDLEKGIPVLFSGTPCQVDGLRSFCAGEKVDTTGMLTVDLVCHGVPSPLLFREYCHWLERKSGHRVFHFNFRNKEINGWHDHVETFELADSQVSGSMPHTTKKRFPQIRRQFVNLFYSNLALRPCCGVCPYTSFDRVSDITLADYWKVEQAIPEMDAEGGVSLVLVNTEKGAETMKNIPDSVLYRVESDREAALQINLREPSSISAKREAFWNLFYSKGSDYVFQVMFPYRWVMRGRIYQIVRRGKVWLINLIKPS